MRRETELLKSWYGNLIIAELLVLLLTKRHVDSGNEIVKNLEKVRSAHKTGVQMTFQFERSF